MAHHFLTLLLLLLLFTTPPPSLARLFLPSHLRRHPHFHDLPALRSLKDSLTDLPGSSFFSTWDFSLPSPNPCLSFSGLTCSPDGLHVTILSLGDSSLVRPALAGFLPESLSSLSSLTQLLLSPGIVTGPIPPQLGLLRHLRVLSLPRNRLTGPIPPSLASLRYLHTLDLSYNQLSGVVPAHLPSLPSLKVLVLSNNLLSGHLPPVSSHLLHLDLSRNHLSGPIPSYLPPSLRYLSLSRNLMWGPINSLSPLPELAYLDLSMNLFSGPVPPSLFRASLLSMHLQFNHFSGGVPAPVDRFDAISYGPGSVVDLSHNSLTGELTAVLAGVESLFLNNNHLTGPVPAEYIDSLKEGRTRTLLLQHNYLTGFPLDKGNPLPDTAAVCLLYNCMVPPIGLEACPASAGSQLSRPSSQCRVFGGRGR
ncbi:hypothetical protein MLD38_026590 [Melastoma candidum]|uniref:Uncharacterized protein n=1 Tax=Melastoma candidum TaxID=119954 RepID=A0ACB9P0Y5_9MYRT|nr:hypothetical protein MLD38_026590 [Melastoma candidum]